MYSVPQNYPVTESNFQKLGPKSTNKSNHDDKASLQCNVCGLIISNKWNFTLHMRVHNNDRRYKCNQCSSSFITSHDLKRHMLAHAGVRPRFKCQFCSKTYASRHSKYLHEDTHNRLEYKCRHCAEVFTKFVDRKSHEKEVHINDKSTFNCSECNKKFTSKKFLENHEKAYHKKEEDAFKCAECELLFETSASLNIHRRSHANKTIVISAVDDFGYTNNKVKTIKKKTPVELFGIRIHECIICTKRFTSRGDMLSHMSNDHPEENKAIFKYPCNMCDKSFKCKQGLTQHFITHTGEKKYSCMLCDYKSKRSADLKVHMRKHTGEAPYVCDKCGRRFQQVKSFQHHKKQHFGKIFKCDLCDAAFYRNRELDWHKQKHTEGGFKCYKCGKLLANPYSLKSHLRIGMCQKRTVNIGKRTTKADRQLDCKDTAKFTIRKNKYYECFACGYSSLSSLDMVKHQSTHKCTDSGNKNKILEDDNKPTNTITLTTETSPLQKLNEIMKVFKSPAEKVDYKGRVSVAESCSTVSNDYSYTTSEICENNGADFPVTLLCQPAIENMHHKFISMNGKAYVALDDLKHMNGESLYEYIKSLS